MPTFSRLAMLAALIVSVGCSGREPTLPTAAPLKSVVLVGGEGSNAPVYAVCFLPDGKSALLANNSVLWKWDLGIEAVEKLWLGDSQDRRGWRFSRDGRLIVYGRPNPGPIQRELSLWNFAGDKPLLTLRPPQLSAAIFESDLSHDGRTLLTRTGDGVVSVWDVASSQKLRDLPPLEKKGHVSCAAWTPDGRVVTAHAEAAHATGPRAIGASRVNYTNVGFRIWDFRKDKLQTIDCPGFGSKPEILTVSPNSKLMVSHHYHPVHMRCWDLDAGQERCLVASGDLSGAVAFLPDNRRLVVGQGRSAIVMEVEDIPGRGTGQVSMEARKLLEFKGHTTRVECIAVSPDGKRVVSAGSGEARLWEMKDVTPPGK